MRLLKLTHNVCSLSVAAILSRIELGLFSVHVESCCSTLILVKTSKSSNLLGSSSSPKGLRSGAFATNWRRVYSSKIAGLVSIRLIHTKMHRQRTLGPCVTTHALEAPALSTQASRTAQALGIRIPAPASQSVFISSKTRSAQP